MKNTPYLFKTTFTIDASREKVWEAILDYHMWPKWWKGLQDIQLIKDTNAPKNHKLACRVGFALYSLRFHLTLDKVIPDKSIQLLSSGDLKGIGIFTFAEKNNDTKTTVTFTWNVETTKTWMNLLAPIARPVFIYEHHLIMNWFAKGLAQHLHTNLISISHS